MAIDPTTAREALMAELLQDVDKVIVRLEQIDETLSGKIEKSTADAAGKAFLSAKLNFESVIDAQAGKLTDAGRHAAAMIGNELNSGAVQLLASNAATQGKARCLGLLLVGCVLVAGVVGGFIGAKLAGM